jgi:hypothetical protein
VGISIQIFLTTALIGVASFGPGRFISGEEALGNHQIGDWMGSRAGIDDLEKRKFLSLPRIEVTISPPFKEIRKGFIEIISTITITTNEHNQMCSDNS